MEAAFVDSGNNTTSYAREMAVSGFLQASFAAFLEYSGLILRGRASASAAIGNDNSPTQSAREEVSIRIVGVGHGENNESTSADVAQQRAGSTGFDRSSENGESVTRRDNTYDVHCLIKCIEHVLPFPLLLLLVFIRQHFQGFLVTIWIPVFIFKSNNILQKQVALKEDRKIYVLLAISFAVMLHVIPVYWWYRNDDLLYPLILLPPKKIPHFWHSIFVTTVNAKDIPMSDVMVQQAAMALKSMLLICFKNSKGINYRKQGQILNVVEYLLLLYRTLLPTPLWYRFFLNKEYGSFFSSFATGLYLTFKLTSTIEKVQLFSAALRALFHKELHYGCRATFDQVKAVGDLCAICQEKMQAPILLQCKHIFCEDCVSEWFERERTCPLCRSLVKPAGIRSYADGSTNLLLQFF